MKRIIAVVFTLAMLVTSLIPINLLATNYDFVYTSFETDPSANSLDCDHDAPVAMTFEAVGNFRVTMISLYITDGGVAGEFEFAIYSVDGNDDPDTELTSGTILNTYVPNADGNYKDDWIVVPIANDVLLSDGTRYAIVVTPTVDNMKVWYYNADGYAHGNSKRWAGSSWTDYATDIPFRIHGIAGTASSIATLGPRFSNNSVTLGGVCTIGSGTNSVIPYIQYGFTTSYTGEWQGSSIYRVDPTTWTFTHEFFNIPLDQEVHYRAAIYSENEGWYYGADNTYQLVTADIEPVFELLPLTDKSFSEVTYNVYLESLGAETSVDLIIQWGETTALSETPITLGDDIDTLGYFDYDQTELSENTQYYYRLKVTGALTGDLFSDVRTFTTPDSSRPVVVNTVQGLFDSIGFTGDGPWWILIIILGCAVWIPRVMRENKIIPIAVDCLLLGTGIVIGVISVWVVALLAIIAALVIGKLLLKGVGN